MRLYLSLVVMVVLLVLLLKEELVLSITSFPENTSEGGLANNLGRCACYFDEWLNKGLLSYLSRPHLSVIDPLFAALLARRADLLLYCGCLTWSWNLSPPLRPEGTVTSTLLPSGDLAKMRSPPQTFSGTW